MADSKNKKLPIHLKSAQQRTLIKGGRVVNTDQIFVADVYVEDGVIKQMGLNLITPGGARIIDATGCYVIPGGIDMHTHLADLDDSKAFYKSTHAALVGGTTTVIATVAPSIAMTHHEALTRYHQMADEAACCHFGLHTKLTGWSKKIGEDLSLVCRELSCYSLVISLSGDSVWQPSAEQMEEICVYCREQGGLIILEIDDSLESCNGEAATGTDPAPLDLAAACAVAQRTNCPLFVSQLECSGSAHTVSASRRQGALVYGGVTSAAVGADGAVQWYRDGRPVASDADEADLLACMLVSELSCVSTDHRCFSEHPDGGGQMRGCCVQDRLSVVWERAVLSGRLDARHFVAVTSTNAAKLLNLYPKKGSVSVGADADLVVWDARAVRPVAVATHRSGVDNMLEGVQCQGVPLYVLCAGTVSVDHSQLRIAAGVGQYVATPPAAPELYLRVAARQSRGGATSRTSRDTSERDGVRHVTAPRPALRSGGATASEPRHQSATNGAHTRPPPAEGVCHQQQSNFKASGEQADDDVPKRTTVKVRAPPGGKSSGSFW